MLAQPLDGALDPALVVQRALGLPDVEAHAEMRQRGLDAGAHSLRCPGADDPVGVGVGLARWPRRPCPDLVRQLGRQLGDIGPAIGLLGQRQSAAERPHRGAKDADLDPEVVEVVLARDAMPGALQHATQEVADEGAARVADVQRAGRVGGHELDVDVARVARRQLPEGRAGGAGSVEAGGHEPWRQAQVDEARRRDLDRGERRAVVDAPDGRGQRLGDGEWRAPHGPCQLHREAERDVAVLGVAGVLDLDRRSLGLIGQGRQLAALDGLASARVTSAWTWLRMGVLTVDGTGRVLLLGGPEA